jgi:hypothetical protein
MCVRSITKGVTIYMRLLGMIIYLNYTFSVPDKRLYTLYKGHNSNSPRRAGLQCVFARPSHLYTRRILSLLRTVPLYTSAVATCHGTLSTEPKATVHAAPLAPNRPMTLPRSQSAPETPRTDRLQP